MTHIGMLNSFNVLTDKAPIDDIVRAGISVFAHEPYKDPSKQAIEFMVFYFKELEMYDKCADLQKYIDNNYNENGDYKEDRCLCEYPDIDEYVPNVKCSVCKKRIKR